MVRFQDGLRVVPIENDTLWVGLVYITLQSSFVSGVGKNWATESMTQRFTREGGL